MAEYHGLYRAKAVKLTGTTLTAYIPQVFGDTEVSVIEYVGGPPTPPEMGWVVFHGGSPEIPVWMGVGTGSGGNGGGFSQAQADLRYLMLVGGTLTGPLVLPAAIPALDDHATTKGYVDTQVATRITQAAADTRYVNITGDTMSGPLTLPGDPTVPLQAATKAYVDTNISAGAVPATRSILTTPPLTGGGDLTINRTLAVSAATEAASGVLEIATVAEVNTGTDNERVVTPLGAAQKAPISRQINTTTPLQGGGDLTATRTLTVLTFGAAQSGVVPQSGGGAVNFLRADGSWATPPGTGLTQAIADPLYVNTSGDTMTGPLVLPANPTLPLQAATKQYVDAQVATQLTQAQADLLYVNTAGDTMTGALTLAAHPIVSFHAATKQYVDDTTSAVMASHLGAADPHAQYINQSEMDAEFLDHKNDVADPHAAAGYMTQADTDLLYRNASYINSGTIGDAYLPATITSDITGNAVSANRWTTARTITFGGGDITGNVSLDGSANVTLTATIVDDSHTHDTRYYTEAESNANFIQTGSGGLSGGGTITAGSLSFGSRTAQLLNMFSTTYAFGVQSNGLYARTPNSFYWFLNGSHSNTQGDAGAGGTSLMTLNNTDLLYKTSRVWHEGNDGHKIIAPFGPDADMLDGHHADDFAEIELVESLLGDLLYVGVYNAAGYAGTVGTLDYATMPHPNWSEGTDVYRNGMYWVCSSSAELNFIDSDASGRLAPDIDGATNVFNGDWIITVHAGYTVTNKALTSNVATLTIGAHTFGITAVAAGKSIEVEGVDTVFDGVYTITATTTTTVSYAKTNANVGSAAVSPPGMVLGRSIDQMTFQYIPFSTETYVKSVMDLHLGAPDPHPQYFEETRGDARWAQVNHSHDAEITQSIVDHQREEAYPVASWRWDTGGIVTLTVPKYHNVRPGSSVSLRGLHPTLDAGRAIDTSTAAWGSNWPVLDMVIVDPTSTFGTVRIANVPALAGITTAANNTPVTPPGGFATNDPHPMYVTLADGTVAFALKEHVHDYEPLGAAAAAVAAHVGLTDPHTQYFNEFRGDNRYALDDHDHPEYSLINHTHPENKETHATDTAVSAEVWVGYVQPTVAMGVEVGDLWIQTDEVGGTGVTAAPPSVVTGFSAAAASTTTINIVWNKWVAAEAVTSILLERSTTGTGPWTPIRSGAQTGGVSLTDSYADTTGLTSGTTYYYRISATNPTGTSLPTQVVSATTLFDLPAIPTAVSAANTSTAGTGPLSIRLTWTNSVTAGATHEVFVNGVSKGFQTSPWTYTTGLTENTSYTMAVRAYVAATGLYSSTVIPSSVTTSNLTPPTVTGLVLTPGATGTANFDRATFTWNAPVISDLQNYRIQLLQGATTLVDTNVINRTYTFTGLAAGTGYVAKVQARDTGPLLSTEASTPTVSTGLAPDTTPPPNVTIVGGTYGFKPEGSYGVMVARFKLPATDMTQYRVDRSLNNIDWTIDLNWTAGTLGADVTHTIAGGSDYAPGQTVYCRVYVRDAVLNVNWIDFPAYTLIFSPTYITATATTQWLNIAGGQYGYYGGRAYQGYNTNAALNATGLWYYGTRIYDTLNYGGRRTFYECYIDVWRGPCGLETPAYPTFRLHNYATQSTSLSAPALDAEAFTPITEALSPYENVGYLLPDTMRAKLIAGTMKGVATYHPTGKPFMCFQSLAEDALSGQLSFYHYG